ncbi:hypothetical protein GCM10010531_33290 [Blastococcus jejuensis]|uniref:PH domain-containing protein n=1 Tax=Blastococcus jejuensis TaxID=351224 RepID=A0ABP6PHN0_9ACTN
MTTTEQPSKRSRRRKRKQESLPPYDGPEAVAPPLAWARRFTPFGIGRRRVRLSIEGGRLTVTRVPVLGAERVVIQAPVAEFHSAAPSRGGRGLHLWHGDRLFRLAGRSTARADGGSTLTLGDDPVSAVIGLILLPFYLFALIGMYTEAVASQRKNVATTLRWLGPVVGGPPPGVEVRPPLPGGWLAAGRWTVRLAVLGALVGGLLAVL